MKNYITFLVGRLFHGLTIVNMTIIIKYVNEYLKFLNIPPAINFAGVKDNL